VGEEGLEEERPEPPVPRALDFLPENRGNVRLPERPEVVEEHPRLRGNRRIGLRQDADEVARQRGDHVRPGRDRAGEGGERGDHLLEDRRFLLELERGDERGHGDRLFGRPRSAPQEGDPAEGDLLLPRRPRRRGPEGLSQLGVEPHPLQHLGGLAAHLGRGIGNRPQGEDPLLLVRDRREGHAAQGLHLRRGIDGGQEDDLEPRDLVRRKDAPHLLRVEVACPEGKRSASFRGARWTGRGREVLVFPGGFLRLDFLLEAEHALHDGERLRPRADLAQARGIEIAGPLQELRREERVGDRRHPGRLLEEGARHPQSPRRQGEDADGEALRKAVFRDEFLPRCPRRPDHGMQSSITPVMRDA
jgi:hypothetical protein